MAATPTPTTYALLGLLAVRPWSAYELAGQATRSLRFFWPRSEAHVYAEVKRLVALGFAEAHPARTGGRRRTDYTITPTGRTALEAWLASPPAPPVLEVEALLRVMFADQGTMDDLLDAVEVTRQVMAERRQEGVAQVEDYLATGGPFPERLHLIALMTAFYAGFADLVETWARFAEEEVGWWTRTDGVGLTPELRAVLERVVAGQPPLG
ncbi:MAG TPA: helix-turn-helix transcriptional regulator [Iamia sp.]